MVKQKIMIIGAGGSLGSALCKLLHRNPDYDVISVDRCENRLAHINRMYGFPIYIADVQEIDILSEIIEDHDVSCVVNTAALKHVNSCEVRIEKAIRVNILSNLNLVKLLKKTNRDFVYISSDKAIKPTNVYALTKQFTDYFVRKEGYKIVRGVNFLNSDGSVIDIWEKQRQAKLPFTLVSEKCSRYFIPVCEMAGLVKDAIDDKSGQIEFTPKTVYLMTIEDLFKAFISYHVLSDYKVVPIKIGSCEKLVEDLNFSPKVIELSSSDEIVSLLAKIFSDYR